MLFLCYFSVNKGKSSESLLSNKNIIWVTDIILYVLEATLKKSKETDENNLIIYFV